MAALLLAATAGCAGPTHSHGDYELKLANTAESLESSAQTVLLATDLLDNGRAFQPYVANVISSAEDDATSAQQTFDSRQPPDDGSDQLRSRADKTLDDVVSAITDARVAARDSDVAALDQAADQLRSLLDQLQRLEDI